MSPLNSVDVLRKDFSKFSPHGGGNEEKCMCEKSYFLKLLWYKYFQNYP